MDHQIIEKILDKYFEGESSLQEEAQLRDYFHQGEVPAHLRPYQPLFRFFEEEGRQKLDSRFDERLLRQLEEKPPAKVRRLFPGRWAAGIAAAVLLAAGLFWLYFPQPAAQPQTATVDWSKYEVKDPEEAFRITRTALMKTSAELNKGAATAAREVGNIREVGKFLK